MLIYNKVCKQENNKFNSAVLIHTHYKYICLF